MVHPNQTHIFPGALRRLSRDAFQSSKRWMLLLGVLPPPLRFQIDLTDGCNLRCPTCSKWQATPSPQELTLVEWGAILGRIRNVSLLNEISVTGGEPLTRPDALPFLRLAKSLGFRLHLISNGWLLSDETLRELQVIGVDRLTLSLNSLNAALHDETRGRPGSHARILHAIEAWRSGTRQMDLCLSTLVVEANCGELTSLARFAQQQGLTGIIFQVLAPAGAHYPFARHPSMPRPAEGWHLHDPRWVRSVELLEEQVQGLLHAQRQDGRVLNPPSQLRNFPLYYRQPEALRSQPCLGLLTRLYIDPFGNMRLCYGHAPLGNALTDDPRRVWRSAAARSMRRASRSCVELCRMLNNNL